MRPRLKTIIALARPHAKGLVVDVGADHGLVARALGAWATDLRRDAAAGRRLARFICADGLSCFRRVDLAIIAGIGPRTILRILSEAPPLGHAVVHSPERTAHLRQGLADTGWRLVEERLAPARQGCHEVLLIRPGREPHQGIDLQFGPLLPRDELLRRHIRHLRRRWTRILACSPPTHPMHREARSWLDHLERVEGEIPGDAHV